MKNMFSRWKRFIFTTMILFLSNQCDESLPPYVMPQNTLALTQVLVEQGTMSGGAIVVNILIQGENQYDEVFQDTINVNGNVKIWWVRKPDFEANLPIKNTQFIAPTPIRGRVMTLAPKEKFNLLIVWYLVTDARQYIPDFLAYGNPDSFGVQHANPETFRIEVELTLFKHLGLLQAEPINFELNGWRKTNDVRKNAELLI